MVELRRKKEVSQKVCLEDEQGTCNVWKYQYRPSGGERQNGQ
jgi:hypothetical protein